MDKSDNLESFLRHAKKETREKLRSKFTSQSLDRGQFVFFEGDPASALYVVETGIMEANVIHGDGKVYIFHFLFPCDVFGEGLLYGQELYPFSVMVREDAVLWKIAKDDLLPVVEGDAGLKKHLFGVIGRKLDLSYSKARCVAGERVERRVACILLKSADEQGIEDCGERVMSQLTNRDISGLIGSTEETVSRIMSRLKKEGVIGLKDKKLVVMDRDALMTYFDSL